MSISAEVQRTTLIITPGQLESGSLRVPYRAGDDDSLLRSYLIFVREMRGQRHARSVTLRCVDIAVIADHLDTTDEVVLGRLLDLMGVTRAQRTLLLAMLAAGALTIVATGSVPVAAISDLGVADAPPAVEQVTPTSARPAADVTVLVDADRSEPGETATLADPQAPTGPDTTRQFNAAIVAVGAAAPLPPPNDVAVGTTDDGSTVAVIAPPTPPTNDVAIGTADDGSTVAVIAPPTPPTNVVAVGIADDGSTVGVIAPPLPPDDPAG